MVRVCAVVLALWAGTANAQSFDDLWMGRVAWPPSDGVATTYSDRFDARGQRIDHSKISCAHPSEPFGSVLTVTNAKTGKTIDCPVQDRGPFTKGRVLDLSEAANRELGCEGRCEVIVRRRGFE
jgi:rare lipoprotein A (peptidoglycan hydrolase)